MLRFVDLHHGTHMHRDADMLSQLHLQWLDHLRSDHLQLGRPDVQWHRHVYVRIDLSVDADLLRRQHLHRGDMLQLPDLSGRDNMPGEYHLRPKRDMPLHFDMRRLHDVRWIPDMLWYLDLSGVQHLCGHGNLRRDYL